MRSNLSSRTFLVAAIAAALLGAAGAASAARQVAGDLLLKGKPPAKPGFLATAKAESTARFTKDGRGSSLHGRATDGESSDDVQIHIVIEGFDGDDADSDANWFSVKLTMNDGHTTTVYEREDASHDDVSGDELLKHLDEVIDEADHYLDLHNE